MFLMIYDVRAPAAVQRTWRVGGSGVSQRISQQPGLPTHTVRPVVGQLVFNIFCLLAQVRSQ